MTHPTRDRRSSSSIRSSRSEWAPICTYTRVAAMPEASGHVTEFRSEPGITGFRNGWPTSACSINNGSRFELMHVKDMKKGTQTGDLTGKSDVKNDVTLGTGMMDWPAILKAAQNVGVKWYFIEDESPASAQQIPLSLRYLERVKF